MALPPKNFDNKFAMLSTQYASGGKISSIIGFLGPKLSSPRYFGLSKYLDQYGQYISELPEVVCWIRPMTNDRGEFDITGRRHAHLNMNARPVWWPHPREIEEAKRSGHCPRSVWLPEGIAAPDYTTHCAFEGEEYSISEIEMQTWQNVGTIGVFARFDALDRDQYLWALQTRQGNVAKVYLSWNAEDYRLLVRFFGISATFSRARLIPDRPYYIQVSWNRGVVRLIVADLLAGTFVTDDGLFEENVARREHFSGWLVFGGLLSDHAGGLYGGFRGIAGDLFFSRICCGQTEARHLTLCEETKDHDDAPVEP